jgi:hypothetical protein
VASGEQHRLEEQQSQAQKGDRLLLLEAVAGDDSLRLLMAQMLAMAGEWHW